MSSAFEEIFRWGPFAFVGVSILASGLGSARVGRALARIRYRIWQAECLRKAKNRWPRELSEQAVLFGEVVENLEDATSAAYRANPAKSPSLRLECDGKTLAIVGPYRLETLKIPGPFDDEAPSLFPGDRVIAVGVDKSEDSRSDSSANPLVIELTGAPKDGGFVRRAEALALTVALFWGASAALGWLTLEASRGRVHEGLATPSDPRLYVHAVPPLSGRAAADMALELYDSLPDPWISREVADRQLALGAALDPDRGRAASRAEAASFRSRAGIIATKTPNEATCAVGLGALAEAGYGGALQTLMQSCSSAHPLAVSDAAFLMGDFMTAQNAEAESITSRVLLAPRDEPDCIVGGYEAPPDTMPLCQLEQAEHSPSDRAIMLAALEASGRPLPPYGALWLRAVRGLRGADLTNEDLAKVDPVCLVIDPVTATLDSPMAVYHELIESPEASIEPVVAAEVLLLLAAGRSAHHRFGDAGILEARAMEFVDIAANLHEDDGLAPVASRLRRLQAALAIRRRDPEGIAFALADLDPNDPLRRLGAATMENAEDANDANLSEWSKALPSPEELRGLSATALHRQWLREGYPACVGCDFFETLAHLSRKADLALALGDAEVLEALGPVLGRFGAVVMNRPLSLSLRARTELTGACAPLSGSAPSSGEPR